MRPHERLKLWKRAVDFVVRRDYEEANDELGHMGRMIVGLAQKVKTRRN